MRHQFIPVRKSEIVAALAADEGFGNAPVGEDFTRFCQILAHTLHFEAYDELEALKHAYFHFNPRMGPAAQRSDASYSELIAGLERVLARANFIEVGTEEIKRAQRARGILPVEVRATTEGYRQLRLFARGSHSERYERGGWFGIGRKVAETDVYDDVVLFAATLPVLAKASRRHAGAGGGAVIIKFFHDIASADLNSLLPDVRVVMNRRDRWTLGLPAVIGGIPLLIKLAPTLTILLVVAGIHFGYTGAVEQDRMKQALAVVSGLAALGGFVAHQWLKYQSKALRYLVAIKDSIYFRNVNNNGGVFDALVGAAEEQDFKESLIAYRFLLAEPCSEPALDARVEGWFREKFSLDIDFEVTDALKTLAELGLLDETGGQLSVPAIGEGLRRLDERWDNVFDYHKPAA